MVRSISPSRNLREIASYSLFLALMGLGMVLAMALIRFMLPRTALISLGQVSQFELNQPQYMAIRQQGVGLSFWVVNLEEGFRVYKSSSTFVYPTGKRCTLTWVEEAPSWMNEKSYFFDPCSGSWWSERGEYIGGPAPRDLDWYPVEIRDRELWIDAFHPQQGESNH
ncbi:MAG: hypothetical protein Fur0022_09600 [Anaerolineales bacterium]